MMSAVAGWDDEPLGHALVFRLWPAQVLHVVGASPLAAEFRRLITAGAVPGWELHPIPAGCTTDRICPASRGRVSADDDLLVPEVLDLDPVPALSRDSNGSRSCQVHDRDLNFAS